jgi:hypothetical protein
MVNWYEIEIFDIRKNKVIYKNSFVTNHGLNDKNIEKIIRSGRTRGQIENENNNILKNQGYNLEHNFGHGKENLAEILLSLNLLAFLFHNVLDLVNEMYKKIRKLLVVRKTFFNDIRALLKYVWFENWNDLLTYMLKDEKEKKMNTS